jgi:phosphoglycerate dehydrogenase-like enzyme
MKIAILCHLWPEAVAALAVDHVCVVHAGPVDTGGADALTQCEVAVVRSPLRLGARELQAASHLRLIVRAGMGLDGLDVVEARRLGIRVVAVPLSADAVAEHVMALLLAMTRNLIRLNQTLRDGLWEKHSSRASGLTGRTLGIIGFGRIGRRVAELARAFRMTLLACDRSPQEAAKQEAARRLDVEFVSLQELGRRSECLCSTLPLNEASRDLLNRGWIEELRPGAYFVNIGRGGTVDEAALLDSLEAGRLAGVGLDVFAVEPPADSPLRHAEGFIGTPHVAAQTEAAQADIGRMVVKVIEAFAAGKDPALPGTIRVT